ncbi:hypothetical protein D3C71_1659030 [compost metagenome]
MHHCGAKPVVDTAHTLLFGAFEQPIAALQPGPARGGMFPGVQGRLVTEAEDDLEFVAIARGRENARA